MLQNLDIELLIPKDLFSVQQNNILWDATKLMEDLRLGKT
jgi:hypothetical protein